MGKDKNDFSVFKLFYNEIIYKNNTYINYYGVEHNINKIRDMVLTLRNTSRINIDFYNTKLNRYKKRIKYHLGKIVEYNNDIMDYFYLLYKTKCKEITRPIEELPIILVNSFYEDYKLDDKGNFNINSVIPKFTSLEKKRIKEETKNVSSLEYFVKLLESSDKSFLYEKFLGKAKYILNIKPLYNETYNDYYVRTKKIVLENEHIWCRLERKARYSEDYENIKEQMSIAYKYKFDDWNTDLKAIVTDYIDKVYNDNKNNLTLTELFNKTNNITYQKYCELVEILINEKDNLMINYENGSFVKTNVDDGSYTIKFKENLINNYFDYRYKNTLTKDSSVNDFVNRAIVLYELSFDLVDQIFEKIMFDSSHSLSLKRNNDVNSALLMKIYELYNPVNLLGIYQKTVDDFNKLLFMQDEEFREQYNRGLNTRKMEYDYHGPLPNLEVINENIKQRRIDFIIEHCITDLTSIDLFNNYDTRNYDLYVMVDGISNDEFVTLYNNIKTKINNFDFSTMNIFNKVIAEDSEEGKNLLFKAAQEFVVKGIYNNMKLDTMNQQKVLDRYRDICYGYLNEPVLFINDSNNTSEENENYDEFLKARNDFKQISKWTNYMSY